MVSERTYPKVLAAEVLMLKPGPLDERNMMVKSVRKLGCDARGRIPSWRRRVQRLGGSFPPSDEASIDLDVEDGKDSLQIARWTKETRMIFTRRRRRYSVT